MLDRSVEAFLDDLLEFVEDGKVVPIIGEVRSIEAASCRMAASGCDQTEYPGISLVSALPWPGLCRGQSPRQRQR